MAGDWMAGDWMAGDWAIDASPPQPDKKLVEAPKEPQLHCLLIGYTGEPRLAVLFDIRQVGSELRYEQLHLVEIRGSHKTRKEPPFPEWRFDTSAEPARLESEISVFDNSAAGSHTEKITIELYDYRPEKSNKEWIESGLKSIHYQNLSGNCQQSRPVPLVSTSN
ncbi:MAG: hypothetical protein ACSLE4_04900 [Methyloceanibacter sp.]